uniref:Major capsid protein N-terminal domain-containing protein n=1 Tax=viral metagenome TaxID=1070528 RepID=A0A6C0BSM0_9ZZZZ
MPGGLLNLISVGNQNIHLNGNPSKTFFKGSFAKYTNFGLQKFRLDMDGQRDIRLTEPSVFTFKVPRYADLLMDTYISIDIPSIWSPIHYTDEGKWVPYEFKWIKNLGTMMIDEVRLMIGGQTIQKLSGHYIHNVVSRDYNVTKKELHDRMTGNTLDIYDPANYTGRYGMYPNAYPSSSLDTVSEPSIRGRELLIPLNAWFTMTSKMALPLVSLQYSEVKIEVTIRPVQDLFTILDVESESGVERQRIRPNFSNGLHSFYRFLHPPDNSLGIYSDTRTSWVPDIHLISTYGFLDEDEIRIFANENQRYLIKEVHEVKFNNVVGTQRLDLKSLGMVTDWMWYIQRSDIKSRNEWSNYSNWKYSGVLPSGVMTSDATNSVELYEDDAATDPVFPLVDDNGNDIYITGPYSYENVKKIMTRCAIIFDGKYRENEMNPSIFEWIDKYSHTNGNGPECLYSYSFCLNTDPYVSQPSGAINMTKFKKIEVEISTIEPPLDPNAATYSICGPDGGVIGVNKSTWDIYQYTYDVNFIEHRYNILDISCGMASLMYAR